MDLLFGAVSLESRRRGRLMVHNDLRGERPVPYLKHGAGSDVSMAMHDVRTRHDEFDSQERSLEIGQDGSFENAIIDGRAFAISSPSELYDRSEGSIEKHRVWTIPE